MWVPGHTGIKGYEIADEHALLAINYFDSPLIEKISYDNSKKCINEIINDK